MASSDAAIRRSESLARFTAAFHVSGFAALSVGSPASSGGAACPMDAVKSTAAQHQTATTKTGFIPLPSPTGGLYGPAAALIAPRRTSLSFVSPVLKTLNVNFAPLANGTAPCVRRTVTLLAM